MEDGDEPTDQPKQSCDDVDDVVPCVVSVSALYESTVVVILLVLSR